jgi:signal transduction histidine kinase
LAIAMTDPEIHEDPARRHVDAGIEAEADACSFDAEPIRLQALGALSCEIAHDFRNYLQAIDSALRLAAASRRRGDLKRADLLLRSVTNTVDRARCLANRLMAFASSRDTPPGLTSVNNVVGSMGELLTWALGPRITLEFELGDGLPDIVCDPNQLESALLNLAANARDAMPGGGRFSIKTRNAVLPFAMGRLAAGPYVAVIATDNGSGMSPSIARKAFETFFTTKPHGRGTGLGLAAVQRFAVQHGGQAELTTKLGVGTSVTLFLPIDLSADAVRHP